MSTLTNWIDSWGVYLGIASLVVFMVFIIWDLAKRNNAGRFGTAILFATLGMGMFGFVIKGIIHVSLQSSGV